MKILFIRSQPKLKNTTFINLSIILFVIILFSCSKNNVKSLAKASIAINTNEKTILCPVKKLFILGDFNGDKKMDTLFQHCVSDVRKYEINNAADPFQNDWDQVINWFYKKNASIYLTTNNSQQDTIRIKNAQGLYCLINIGDNNKDGKDEIAFVVDYLDFSSVNSCKIYTLCNHQWTNIKQFGIHEGSFMYESDEAPIFKEIKDYLEKKNGEWVYKDYSINEYESADEVGKMLPLKLELCN